MSAGNPAAVAGTRPNKATRSSSREVGIRVPLFLKVYFSISVGNPPQKELQKRPIGGPRRHKANYGLARVVTSKATEGSQPGGSLRSGCLA